jgi:hypothetical protein
MKTTKKYWRNQPVDVQSRYSETNLEYVSKDDEKEVFELLKVDTNKEFVVRYQEGEMF